MALSIGSYRAYAFIVRVGMMSSPIRMLVAGELNPDFVLSGYTSFPCPGHEVLADNDPG
jgi:hypothetical protein